mmetsp:Transcript_23054/g.22451  ORF Transcript_23054/g.22451 Transcript_23054/m.22451 type:complete len:92 (-) Transcript_23054:1724-1999(-)
MALKNDQLQDIIYAYEREKEGRDVGLQVFIRKDYVDFSQQTDNKIRPKENPPGKRSPYRTGRGSISNNSHEQISDYPPPANTRKASVKNSP